MGYYNIAGVDPLTTMIENLANTSPGPLAHMDMTTGNIAIGDLVPALQSPEHVISPILKLIDFGEAEEIPDPAARQARLG